MLFNMFIFPSLCSLLLFKRRQRRALIRRAASALGSERFRPVTGAAPPVEGQLLPCLMPPRRRAIAVMPREGLIFAFNSWRERRY